MKVVKGWWQRNRKVFQTSLGFLISGHVLGFSVSLCAEGEMWWQCDVLLLFQSPRAWSFCGAAVHACRWELHPWQRAVLCRHLVCGPGPLGVQVALA